MPLPDVHVDQLENVRPPLKGPFAWLDSLALLVLMAIGSAIRFSHLTAKPFWFDECFSAEVARLRLGAFLRVIWWREANMSLYYVLLRPWLGFGQSEFFIRSLSVFFAIATIPAIYWLARLIYNRRIALLAAIFFTFNAYNVRYSQEARSYTLFVLLAALSSAFFIAWLRRPTRGHRIGYILSSSLAVYAHFYALLLIVAQWIALRALRIPAPENAEVEFSGKRAIPWKQIGIAVFPLLCFIGKTGAGPIRWIHRPGIGDLLRFWRDFSGGANWLLPVIFGLACLAVASARDLIRRSQNWQTWGAQFLFIWLLFPLVLTIGLSFLHPVFLPRFLIFCQPALLILVAAGIARLRKPVLIAPALAVVVLLGLQGVFYVYGHDYDDQRDGSSAAVNFILDHARPGDAIIFHISEARVPYEFFRSLRAGENTASPNFTGQLGPYILFPHFGPGLDYSDFKGRPVPEILRSVFPGYSRVWVMFMYSQGGGAGRTTAMLTRLLPQSFPDHQCREFPKVEVCLYDREPATGISSQF